MEAKLQLMLGGLILVVLGTGCFCHSPETLPPPPLLLCANPRTPVVLGAALSFCGYSGLSCCDAVDDAALREEFVEMMLKGNTSDVASDVKGALCARKCKPFLPPDAAAPPVPQHDENSTLCLERVAAGSYVHMAPHPDGSGRVFLSTPGGNIWLASLPRRGAALLGTSPFLDLTDGAHHHHQGLRLMGVAFHPLFATNGRFFVSYASGSPSPAGGNSCRYQLVVAEFAATRGGDGDYYSKAVPSEVRKVFTMCLPTDGYYNSSSNQQHEGQILFRPTDSDRYLYLIVGHGGLDGEFSRVDDKASFLGKIVRLGVDLSGSPRPEIFATGLSNPRGCSFDSQRPDYLYCANVDEQRYETVYVVPLSNNNKTGNGSASSPIISHGRPAAGRAPSILGGLVYRV